MDWLENHPFIRILSTIGLLLGLLIGLGTVIGWVASDSFTDTAFTATRVAGLLYGIGLSGGVVVYFLWPGGEKPLLRRTAAIAFAGFALFSVGYWGAYRWEDPWFFFAFGCAGILYALGFAIVLGEGQRSAYSRSRMECPDCAETVKSRARVCRYCGYRFQPPPAALGRDTAVRSGRAS